MSQLDLTPEEIRNRYALLCRSCRVQPDRRLLPRAVQEHLAAMQHLLDHDLQTLAQDHAPDGYANIMQALQTELERLREFCAYPHLGEKLTVAVGGSFSAGKSSLINALLGQKLLVVEIDPTTSLPTYLLHGDENSISALNLFGNRIALSEAEFNSLTHDETQLYGSNINRLLKSAFITSPDFAWNNLAIIDTPGYTKHEDAQHSERTDETIALAQLQAAQAIIWVVSAAQGCITEDDVQFLSQLDANTPKLIVLTRADQKSPDDLPAIVSGIKSTLTKREIAYLDVLPVSARKPQAWPLDAVHAQLAKWNEQTRPLRFAHTLQSQFSRYTQHLEKQVSQARQQLQWCNTILTLANQAEITAPATEMKAYAQQELAAAQHQQTVLTDIQSRFFFALQAVGDEMGMAMRVDEVLAAVEKERAARVSTLKAVAAKPIKPATPTVNLDELFLVVPETTLPNGTVVPSFQVARYVAAKDHIKAIHRIATVPVAEAAPWVNINFSDAKDACQEMGGSLITETQWLAIAHDVVQQDCNWTGGKVGKGKLFQGLRKNTVSSAQNGRYVSPDPSEQRWLTLSNGEKICDMNGNVWQWVFDDVQGGEDGTIAKAFDKRSASPMAGWGLLQLYDKIQRSASLSTPPFMSGENGIGSYADLGTDRSGDALGRGGYWNSDSNAGVFALDYYLFFNRDGNVSFRCTKPL